MTKDSGARTFIISGCASGIGKHMAVALSRDAAKHRLVLLDIDRGRLEAVAREHGLDAREDVLLLEHDVRNAERWDEVVRTAVQRFGQLDVVLNIAGCLSPGFVHEVSPQELDRQIDVNVKGTIHATRAAARQMVRQGHGHIVNIASIAGIGIVPGLAAYCASKHAVRGFSLSVAHELRAHGVRVSVVCPDAVDTPMLELQAAHREAAMTFGGGRGLTLDEIEAALRSVLAHKPLELVVPVPGSGRGILAKLSSAFPHLARLGIERTRKQGERAQVRFLGSRANEINARKASQPDPRS